MITATGLLRAVAAGLLAGVVCLGAASCGLGGRADSAPEARHHGFEVLRGKPAVLWIDWARCAEPLRDPDQALAFALSARDMGITHLGLETRDHSGVPVLGGEHRYAESATALREAAAATGLRLALVHPLFLANAAAEDPAGLVHYAEWEEEGPAVRLFRPGSDDSPGTRLSPALQDNRARELEVLGAVLGTDLDFDVLILSEAGFPALESGVEPAARRAFELWSGLSFRRWPAEVLGDAPPPNPYMAEARGELWHAWLAWRATVWKDFLGALRRTAEEHHGPDGVPPITLLVDAPYPMHLRQGVNWASPARPVTEDFGWLPRGYETTGTGHLLDGVILGLWEPGLLTREQAEDAGFAWWASLEGSAALAERYRRGESAVWSAVPVGPGGWARTAGAALEETEGLLLIGAGDLLENPEYWEELGSSRPF